MKRLYFIVLASAALLSCCAAAQAAGPQLNTSNSNLVTRVAPGDPLPISVTLTNFGGGQSTDVTVTYQVLSQAGTAVLTSTETVAVATTASYTKVLQIPRDLAPGTYTASSSITYQGQKVPATSSYQFTVERKVVGIFLSDFITYAVVTLLVGIAFAAVAVLAVRRRRTARFAPQEYPGVPAADRMYYEIISDVIMQMRYRIGDRALSMARGINGLVVNEETGRVLKIEKQPAQVIAALISEYEKVLGQKFSFAFRGHDEKIASSEDVASGNLLFARKRPAGQ